jgi:tRNA(Ile2) C34 agmatinyltransferase TiaS
MAQRRDSSLVTVAQAPMPAWRICRRCGHMWRSRSRGLRFRCRRCERRARAAALAAARTLTEATS